MSYSESFEGKLHGFLDEQFLSLGRIDTEALDTPNRINAYGEELCKAGVALKENAITTEDRFAIFQIQSLGLLMETISYAVPPKRTH